MQQDPPWVGFRVNTLLADITDVIESPVFSGIGCRPVSWRPDAFLVPFECRQRLVNSKAFTEGQIYLQNLSSMFTAQLLSACPEEQVLDLAAAPGGKTLILAQAMKNRGRIAAVEVVKNRFYKLTENLRRCGVQIANCYHKDGSKVGRQCPSMFDRVLLDAPCSAESRIRANRPDTYAFWNLHKIKDMQRKQKQLLHSAILALKPGGLLVYSTCSYAPEENELVIERQLQKFAGQLEVLPVEAPFSNTQTGLTQWQGKPLNRMLSRTLRILPDPQTGMEGFFVCLLKKDTACVE